MALTPAERARRYRLRRAGADVPKGQPGRKGTGETDAQVKDEEDVLDLPLLEPFGQLPDGRLVLADAAGALYVASSVASLLEGDDSDEPCPTCGEVHEVLDDEEAPGDGAQGREHREPETGAAERKPASTAEPADATLHTHQHKPDGIPMHHSHPGGDKPHAHQRAHKTVVTTGYRPPKAPAAPKAAAKAPTKLKVPTQVAPAPKPPAKGAPRRPIVTTAWHAHRAASEHERKGDQ
jgi:hypothetical protein